MLHDSTLIDKSFTPEITSPKDPPISKIFTVSTYGFPEPECREYQDISNDELKITLAKLNTTFSSKKLAAGYFEVRNAICAINLEMNFRQEHAPRFRPMVDLKKMPGSPEEAFLSLDRQIIDMHWVVNSEFKTSRVIDKHPMMESIEVFDFIEAAELAMENWSAENKANELLLPPHLQWQCAVIQKKSIRDRWRVIKNGDVRGKEIKQCGVGHIEMNLREAINEANNTGTLKHLTGMLNVWIADCIVGSDPKKIAKLVALMTGEKPRDPSAISKTLDSLKSYLKIARTISP